MCDLTATAETRALAHDDARPVLFMATITAPPLSMALEIETVEPAADTRAPSLCTCDEWNDFDHFERVTGESCATTVAGP